MTPADSPDAAARAASDWPGPPTVLVRLLPKVAAILGGAGIGIILIALLVWGGQGFRPLIASLGSSLLSMGTGALASLIHILIGWRLAARVPRNPIGWLVLAAGLTFALVIPIGLLVTRAHDAFRPAPGLTLILAWAQSSFGIPILALMSLLAATLFPNGRLVGPRWWVVPMAGVLAAVLVGASAALDPAGIVWYPTLPNPFGAPPEARPVLAAVRGVGVLAALAASALVVASVVARYRTGDSIVRAQVRWLVFGASIEVGLFAPFLVVRYLVNVGDSLGELFVAIGELGATALPLAIGAAITRTHLFGIDTLISRTILYALLTAIVGGMSTAIVAISQRLFVALTGQSSDAPIVIAVFLAAATFTPVRHSLEGFLEGWRLGSGPPPGTEVPARDGDGGSGLQDALSRPSSASTGDTAVLAQAESTRSAWEAAAMSAAFGSTAASARPSTPRPIDAAGTVACPRRGAILVASCLECSRLGAILAVGRTVVCLDDTTPTAGPRA